MTTYKLMIVGEAWGEKEEEAGRPFVGPTGDILKQLLSQVGISFKEAYATNVFNLRPQPTNDIKNLCGPKSEGIPHLKSLAPGKYVRKEYYPELQRLWKEVEIIKPNLILALGGTALWALCAGQSKISKTRGTLMESHRGPKLIATYHPAVLFKGQWALRPVILADLEKAAKQMEFPEFIRPERWIWIEPTLDDLFAFEQRYIAQSNEISIDIENPRGVFTCIGFAPSIDRALVVPFYDHTKEDGNYWSLEDEKKVWEWVRRICATPRKVYVGQNFLYDAHVLLRELGITTAHNEDTMLMHHAMQPEMEKSLGFLGSIYTEEPSWKFMRKKKSRKKEDE